jgi:hypothetical protein
MKLFINLVPFDSITTKAQPICLVLVLLGIVHLASAQHYLQRSKNKLSTINAEVTTASTSYKPIFGTGDVDGNQVKGVKRFGLLSLSPNGESKLVDYGREELVYYVLGGSRRSPLQW